MAKKLDEMTYDELEIIKQKSEGRMRRLEKAMGIWLLVWLIFHIGVLVAKAEDCYNPTPQTNISVVPVVETYRYNPRGRLKAQVKRRTKRKKVDTFTYFINRKAKAVTASFATLGFDMSYGVGKKQDLDIALKIAQGWESKEDFGSWWEGKLQFEHELAINEIQCEMRNECRATYKDKQLLTACFQELKKWPELRKMLPTRIVSFGEMVTIRTRG